MKKINLSFKYIVLTFAFAISFIFVFTFQISAANFALNDGTTSEITYGEGQILYTVENNSFLGEVTYTLVIPTQNTVYYYLSGGMNTSYVYFGCTYSNNSLTCTKRLFSSLTTSTVENHTQIFTIGSNTVTSGSLVYTILPDYADGYNAGYSAGIGDNQQNIYNNGYNAGYSAGESAGLTTGYNNGYSAGESAGLTTGYNNGYSAGESAGLTTGYNNGYNAGYSAGESAGLTTGYNNGYSAGYNEGYDFGFSVSADRGIIINSCLVTGLVNDSTFDCYDFLVFENGVFNFSSLRSYLDNNSLIDGRFAYDLKFDNYVSNDFSVFGSTYSNWGVYVYFYDNNTLVGTFDFSENQINDFSYLDLSTIVSSDFNRIVFSNANYDYSIKTFGFYDSASFDTGYDLGYDDGYDEAIDDGGHNSLVGMVGAIFTGPVTLLTSIFDFEFLGINLVGVILSLLTLIVVVWLVKKFI